LTDIECWDVEGEKNSRLIRLPQRYNNTIKGKEIPHFRKEDQTVEEKKHWKRWWWYKKYVNVGKLSRRKNKKKRCELSNKMMFITKNRGGGGNGGRVNMRSIRNLHFSWNGNLFEFKNVRGNGWCVGLIQHKDTV
jgi:hypothetical protein